MMKFFRVGGCVRDALLGLPIQDEDFVVVGATAEDMLEKGFQPIDASFPVFHDSEKREFALARTERKVSSGHKGFDVSFDKNTTLEDDLIRRDLTINAMAEDEDGNIIDPFGGQDDINNKILRHTSEAFSEDPLRVLRVLRFRTRFGDEWKIANETKELMHEIVSNGEIQELPVERIWMEFEKSLNSRKPEMFIEGLREFGILKIISPKLDSEVDLFANMPFSESCSKNVRIFHIFDDKSNEAMEEFFEFCKADTLTRNSFFSSRELLKSNNDARKIRNTVKSFNIHNDKKLQKNVSEICGDIGFICDIMNTSATDIGIDMNVVKGKDISIKVAEWQTQRISEELAHTR